MPGELTEAAFDSLPTRVAVLDETGQVVESNTAWQSFTDANEHPLATDRQPYLDALRESSNEQAVALANRLQSLLDSTEDEHTSEESKYQTDIGGLCVRYALLTDDGHRYAVLTHHESDDRGEAATDLRLKERAMDEAPVGITISDPSQPDNPVIYANDAFERITDYSIDEVLGRNCRFLQGEDTDPETVDRMRHAVDNWEPVTVEVRNYRRGGEEFWNQVTIAPIYGEDGEPSHFVGFQQDVSDRKGVEQSLETERDRLALLNQIVRHDIRNDMSVALGWGNELATRIPEAEMEAFERIMTAATHTKELTEAVGDLADILGATHPELEPIALDDTLKREIERVRSNFDYRAEGIRIEGDEDVPAIDVLATSLLSSVFGNLLDNAVFHNDKSDIVISVDVEVRPETVRVRVSDNGPGISDAHKREVFGRGEKGLESSGSGLGLYLVDNLVETYGGRVWIADTETAGTAICVELQRAHPDEA